MSNTTIVVNINSMFGSFTCTEPIHLAVGRYIH